MSRENDVSIPVGYEPLSAWAYFGYRLLFSIPVVGFILLIVFSCGGSRNRNLRSYARSYWCSLIITLIVVGIILGIIYGAGVSLENYGY